MSSPSTVNIQHAGKRVSDTNPLPVTLGGTVPGADPVPAFPGGTVPLDLSVAEFTRPANTTDYAAADVVSNSTSAPVLLEFADLLPVAGAAGIILAARAFTNVTAFATPLRLHLYKADDVTPINDNAAFTLLYANRAKRVGYIDFGGWQTGGSGSDAAGAFGSFPGSGSGLPVELAEGETSLWGVVETRGIFTPASAQQFFFSLKACLA